MYLKCGGVGGMRVRRSRSIAQRGISIEESKEKVIKAIVIGGTGATGKELVAQLFDLKLTSQVSFRSSHTNN